MAAAAYGKRQGEPPPALVLAWRCQRWKTLPIAGGLFNQPLTTMTQMEAAQYTADAFEERARAAKRGKLIEWCEENPQLLAYCRMVDEWLNDAPDDQQQPEE